PPQMKTTLRNISQGDNFRIVVTGVGGSGVTTISRVLSHAAKSMEGLDEVDFKFVDQKGLAQRNGNVTAHLSFFKKGKSLGAVTAFGEADVLLSPDLLDGATHIRFLNQKGLALLDEKYQVPLSVMLDNEEAKAAITEGKMKKMIKRKLGENVCVLPMKEMAEVEMGRSVYSSAVCLGAAFQAGCLPFSLESLRNAFKTAVRSSEVDNNLHAFYLGRKLFLNKDNLSLLFPKKNNLTSSLWRRSVRESILPWQNKSVLLSMFELDVKRLQKIFPKIKNNFILQYIHDLYVYNRNKHREDFFEKAANITIEYPDLNLQKIALSILVRSYFVKDEIFVSHIMISPVQKKRENDLYSKWGKRFRVIPINRPSFNLGPIKLEFDISPRVWMLKIMRHMRILRLLLPGWHKKEREINSKLRTRLFSHVAKLSEEKKYSALMRLLNIKGYREIRYKKAETVEA
ncbi:MAG: 2-oxoacid:acceptor oxidoreductase family protein, partial [Halobacteriovoraceae bacterium]|nr:2-oxoacid:acceptor oxidoreductase family protein [Halobacteriovoraceae bacterium]